MSKLDNIFAKVIADPAFCKEYGVNDPERYDNIAVGLKSPNGYVAAVATAIKEISTAYELQRSEMSVRHKDGPVVLQDNDFRSTYKKIISILEKTR